MEPQSPISELDRRNVTLFCDVLSGNPSTLTGVRWYMDGDLLKELPQCDYTAEDEDDYLCDVDPDKLLLEHVSRLFHGNFSCVGINEAGWSQMSPGIELEVLCKWKSLNLLMSFYLTSTYISFCIQSN